MINFLDIIHCPNIFLFQMSIQMEDSVSYSLLNIFTINENVQNIGHCVIYHHKLLDKTLILLSSPFLLLPTKQRPDWAVMVSQYIPSYISLI
jgi:hypothetical protein